MNLKNQLPKLIVLLYFFAVGMGLWQVLYLKGTHLHIPKKEPLIAVIPVRGIITNSERGALSGSANAEHIRRRLKSISEREDVKAVVLQINSPGGSVGAVQEIYDEIGRVKRSGKKVVASLGEVAASGGYYLASACDLILAEPGTLTGSIGVIFQVGNVQEFFRKIGLRVEVIKSQEHKDIGSPFRSMTAKEREIFQNLIDDAYQQFLTAIRVGRKMEQGKLMGLADGRIFSGAQAKEAGLVDEFGNVEKAIEKAAEIAGIPGKPKILRDEDPFQKLFSFLSEQSQAKVLEIPLSSFGIRFAYLWEYAI